MGDRKLTTIDVVEAVYDALGEHELSAWMTRVCEAVHGCIGDGLGAVVHTYDLAGPPERWSISTPIVLGAPEEFGKLVAASFEVSRRSSPEVLVRCLHDVRPAATLSELTGVDLRELSPQADSAARLVPVADQICFNAANADGTGIAIAVNVGVRRRLPPAHRRRIEMLTAHVAAAARIAGAVERRAAAVFDPSGKAAHVERQHESRLRTLREHVTTLERVRAASARRDPDDALRAWQALVAGEYTLLDRFESDGRRFVVAVSNAPTVRDPRGLTDREAVVAAWAARGHSDKLIAYELGIAPATVAVLLSRVLRKLRLRTRAELPTALRAPECVERVDVDGDTKLIVMSATPTTAESILAKLTNEERDVARSVLRGLRNEEIALERKVSRKTVANQLTSIYRKLGVGGRVELAKLLGA
ncbi:MAG: hypothetical protein JST00_26175 [Deltaproteobacteria bacterium]|nr:hypothetical protein [Deltaproteobacteria bacterium]